MWLQRCRARQTIISLVRQTPGCRPLRVPPVVARPLGDTLHAHRVQAASWSSTAEATAAAGAQAEGHRTTSDGAQQRWDITAEKWVDIKYQEEDLARFPVERAVFRGEPRLKSDAVACTVTAEGMDMGMTLRGAISATRIGDCYTPAFEELVWDRIAQQNELLELFQIPLFEDKSVVQPIAHKAVPGEGTYIRVRMQSYWLALHVWLLHSKQHALQKDEGLFGSALCTLLTRRLFEFQWNRIRMLLHAADVPTMSVSNELQDLQEFIFGMCVALDDAFRDEVASDTASAVALEDGELIEKCLGLAPRLKYILWANVYSGAIPHDERCLHELTTYVLRQRIALEKLPRDAYLSCRFDWVEHPLSE